MRFPFLQDLAINGIMSPEFDVRNEDYELKESNVGLTGTLLFYDSGYMIW
jgi:hypothetical protein